jgi:hypothetical protein
MNEQSLFDKPSAAHIAVNGDAYTGILPVQYFDFVGGRTLLSGDRDLMFAVLEDGIRCYLLGPSDRNKARQSNFEETRAWIDERGGKNPFSFETPCETFQIDPEGLRQRLKSLNSRHLPRLLPPVRTAWSRRASQRQRVRRMIERASSTSPGGSR